MAVPVEIGDATDPVHWEIVFLSLAVKRCQPLLQRAGVPARMAASPKGLMTTARRFLRSLKQIGYPRGQGDREYARALESLLRETFNTFGSQYGNDEAAELFQWMLRYSTDISQRNRWIAWSVLFAKMADAYDSGPPATASPLSPDATERFTGTVRAHIGGEIGRQDDEAVDAAERIRLSPVERELIKLEETWVPGGKPEIDVTGHLREVMRIRRAHLIWLDLRAWLSPVEKEALLHWGLEEASHIHMAPDLVTLPDL